MISIGSPQLRWPHWVLIGLAVGTVLGGIRVLIGPAYLDSTARTLSRPQFERAVTATPAANFAVSDLVIHPSDASGAYWVTGRYRERGQRRDISADFKFRASTPYQPSIVIDSTDLSRLTIAQYLDELARHIPQANCRYRYAWHERPGAAMLLWISAATLLIGGVWPMVLRQRAGKPMQAEPVSQTACEPEPQAPAPLDVPSLEPVKLAAPQEEKHYGGEFYPTEVHIRH